MREPIAVIAAAVAALFVVAGCGGNETAATPVSSATSAPSEPLNESVNTSPTSPTATESFDCGTLDEKEMLKPGWTEECVPGGESNDGGEDAPTVGKGEPLVVYAADPPGDGELTVTSVDCTRSVVKLTGMGDVTEHRAAAGKHLCIIDASLKNVGTQPINQAPAIPALDGTDGRSYAGTDEDNVAASGSRPDTVAASNLLGDPVNPGDTLKVRAIFQVPASVQAVRVVVQNIGDETTAGVINLQ